MKIIFIYFSASKKTFLIRSWIVRTRTWLSVGAEKITMDSLGVTDEFEEFKRRASTGGIVPLKSPIISEAKEGDGTDEDSDPSPMARRRRNRAQSAGVLRLPIHKGERRASGSTSRERSPDTLDPKFSLEQFRVRSDSGGSATLLTRSRSGGSDRSALADDYLTLSSDEGGDFGGEPDVPKIRLKRPSVPVNQTTGPTISGAKHLPGLADTKEEAPGDNFLSVSDKPIRRKSDLDRSDSWEMGSMRPRISSMPGPGDVKRALWGRRKSRTPDFTCPCGCHLRKVRSFTIDHKTLEVHHEGDLFVTKSNPSLSSLEKMYWCPGGHLSAASSCTSGSCATEGGDSIDSSLESVGGPDEKHYVVLLGKAFVGKSSLISSFLSETTIGSVSTSVGEYRYNVPQIYTQVFCSNY